MDAHHHLSGIFAQIFKLSMIKILALITNLQETQGTVK